MDARISSSSGHETRVTLRFRNLSQQERRARAGKALAICWLISLATLPLPPVHWVTVPGFFLFGIYLAGMRWREISISEAFVFSCPECAKEVTASPQASKITWEVVCPHCRFPLRIRVELEQRS